MPFTHTVSLDVADRRAVVIGGGPMAALRAGELARGGARVTVVSPVPSPEVTALVETAAIEAVHRRPYRCGDLDGAFLAYATREEPQDVVAIHREARRRRVLLSVADDVEHCDFAATAVVRRGDLTVSVATAGRAPALAARLRRHLEALLPAELASLVDAVEEARTRAGPRTIPFDDWAARWRAALTDLDVLVHALRRGRRDAVVEHLVASVVTDPAARSRPLPGVEPVG